jgi:hypothetical protein
VLEQAERDAVVVADHHGLVARPRERPGDGQAATDVTGPEHVAPVAAQRDQHAGNGRDRRRHATL